MPVIGPDKRFVGALPVVTIVVGKYFVSGVLSMAIVYPVVAAVWLWHEFREAASM
jgi:hypothetical protein